MSPEDWDLVRKIFDEALDVPQESRLDWLGQLDAPTGVVAEVARLLKHREKASPDLDKSPLEAMREGRKAKNIFVAGQVVAERFLVDSFLGRGGMGEVYAAMDTESRERIALKVIAGAAVEEQEAQARLRRELLTARKVTHPNVCRVHDLARHDGMLCLTMELLDGETLAQALARGPLDVARAGGIARQIAAGLGAAHAAGVLHRDLKPSNVMLGTGRVVLMDFGLAKSVGGLFSSITASGTILGTPDYMAPEQVEGGRATERTDIYAFGLILYEMLTGRKAFVGDTPLAAAMQRVKREAPRLGDAYPKLWRDVVARCLERDAERRFASAEEVRAALDGEIAAGRRDPLLTKRRAVIFASGLGGVSLFAGGWRLWDWKGKPVSASALVLTDITNTTGDPKFDGATIVLRNQLSQSAQFEVLSPSRVAELLARMEKPVTTKMDARTAREVALRHGAQAVVYGALNTLGPDYVLNVKLEMVGTRPDSVRESAEKSFQAGGREDLLAKIHGAATWIREQVGESASQIAEQDRRPQDLTTGDWEALHRYRLAVQRRAQKREPEAEILLREAIALDPGFISAQRMLADLLVSEFRYPEAFAIYPEVMKRAQQKRLANWEYYRLEAMFWDDAEDWAKAERVYAAWAAHYPKDYVPLYYQATKLSGIGRDEEALQVHGKSLELRNFYGTHEALSAIYASRGRFDLVQREVEELRKLGHRESAALIAARALAMQGKQAEAVAMARELREASAETWKIQGAQLLTHVEAEFRDLDKAMEAAKELAARAAGVGNWPAIAQLSLGWLQWQAKDAAGARQAATRAIELEPGPGIAPRVARLYALAGDRRGLEDLAKLAAGWPRYPVFTFARLVVDGELSLLRGRAAEGLRALEEAAALQPRQYARDFLAHAYARVGDSRAEGFRQEVRREKDKYWRTLKRYFPGALGLL